ncbi:MAG: CheR family methyltransferase [Xenococcaceae cyanobacterium]
MSHSIFITPQLNQAFCDAIALETGIVIGEKNRQSLNEKIAKRMQILNLKLAEEYFNLLNERSWKSYQEWSQLSVLLTNNESYFFRDEHQLSLLKNHIFPELIQRNQAHRTLRICSMGCSTGEEPYSLAILLKETIPNLWQWNLKILAIDLDLNAIAEAQKGIYSAWSFRGVSASIKQQYFRQVKDRYHLSDEIKKMVEFRAVNIVKDAFPQAHTELREMDLIICRNVFIYFEEAATAQVLEKIYYTLKPSGFFLAGHTELSAQDLSRFTPRIFSESIIYQRQDEKIETKNELNWHQNNLFKIQEISPSLSLKDTNPISHKKNLSNFTSVEKFHDTSLRSTQTTKITPVKSELENKEEQIRSAETLLEKKQYQLAIETLDRVLQQTNNHFQACCLMAQIYANLGKYQEVSKYCQQAIAIDSFSTTPHYLLAQVAEERGNLEEAKRIFKKIIYLEPNSVAAYIDLSYLYQQDGDIEKTIKMQREAFNILKQLPSHTKIREKGNLTVAELLLQLEVNI